MKIEATPRGLLAMFFRQQMKFILAFLFILYASLGYIYMATPLYMSTGSILIKFGNSARPDVSLSEHTETDIAQNDQHALLESYLEILQSHDLLAKIVNEFGPEQLYPQLAKHPMDHAAEVESAIRILTKSDLVAKTAPSANIIDVTLYNRSAQLSARFLHRLLELFILRQTEMYNKPQLDFVSDQVKHVADQLADAQRKLQDYKARTGLSSVEEELTQRLQEKSDAENGALENINEARSKVEDLKFKESELLATYREDSVAVRQLRTSLALAEQSMHAREEDLKAATNLTYGSAAAQNGAPLTALASHIADINARIVELEGKRNQYNDLERQVQIFEENYKTSQRKLEEARLNDILNQQNITRISVLDEPVVPLMPAKPNKTFILLLSLIAGLFAGLGAVALAELLDQRFSNPQQLAALLEVPVLATFSKARKRR